jgi:hypothetical protein
MVFHFIELITFENVYVKVDTRINKLHWMVHVPPSMKTVQHVFVFDLVECDTFHLASIM